MRNLDSLKALFGHAGPTEDATGVNFYATPVPESTNLDTCNVHTIFPAFNIDTMRGHLEPDFVYISTKETLSDELILITE